MDCLIKRVQYAHSRISLRYFYRYVLKSFIAYNIKGSSYLQDSMSLKTLSFVVFFFIDEDFIVDIKLACMYYYMPFLPVFFAVLMFCSNFFLVNSFTLSMHLTGHMSSIFP